MRIRISGTKEELELAKQYYLNLSSEDFVKSVTVSNFYPNRGSVNIFRLYIDIEYKKNFDKLEGI